MERGEKLDHIGAKASLSFGNKRDLADKERAIADGQERSHPKLHCIRDGLCDAGGC